MIQSSNLSSDPSSLFQIGINQEPGKQPGNKLLVDYSEENVRAFTRRSMGFPLLSQKLSEIYYDKKKDINIYADLRCQIMELDFSIRLLKLLKSTSISDLEAFHVKTLRNCRDACRSPALASFVKLVSLLVGFISGGGEGSRRLVFVAQE